MAVGLGPGNFVLDGDPAPLSQKEARAPSQFSSHFYCDRTVGWIKMPLDTEVGLGLGDVIVLDADPAPPPQTRTPPNLRPMSTAYVSGYHFGTELGLGLGDIVLDGDPALSPKDAQPPISAQRKRAQPPPNIWPTAL